MDEAPRQRESLTGSILEDKFMEFETVISAISTVGFPIAATLILGYLFLQEQKDHKEETDSLKDAINSNTLIMTELKQLLEDYYKKEA